MQKDDIEIYLSNFSKSESSYPFGPEALVYKIMGKIFALVAQGSEKLRVTFKCTPADGETLINHFQAITPGYHMNKRHWITIDLDSDVDINMLKDLASRSYDLVVSKLTKAEKSQLGLDSGV